MIDKHRHLHRIHRAPTGTLPNWVIVLMAAGVGLAAVLARSLG